MSQTISTILVAEYTNRAGTETYLLQLLSLISQYETDVVLLTIGGEATDKVSRKAEDLGFTHFRMSKNSRIKILNPRIGKQLLQQLSGLLTLSKVERVIVSVGTPGALTGFLKLGASSFYILHTYPHGKRQKLLGRMIASVIPQETTLLCVSKYSKLELLKHWGKRLKVFVVPNGVPSPEISVEENSSGPVVLTLGSVEAYKNPELWLEIALRFISAVPDTTAQFIWVGEGSQLERITKQIPPHLREQIHFVGSVDDTSDYFRRATIYIQPSKIESFGLAVAEALSYGIPCVVADTGGMPEVVNEKCSILVSPDDVNGYVAALTELLENNRLRSQMSINAFTRHADELSIESWQTRMANTLDL